MNPELETLRAFFRSAPFMADLGIEPFEGEAGLVRARTKLTNKGGNLFVYNDVSRSDIGFESDWNELVLLTQDGERMVSRRSKEECAVAILDEIETLLGGD